MKTEALETSIEVIGTGYGYEADCIIEAYYKDMGETFDLPMALVGLDLCNQNGNFFVFLDGQRNALKIPVKDVLVQTNMAGSVTIDGALLERAVKKVVVRALSKR